MGQFEFTLNKIIKSERISASFPVIMGVNAFGGVLSEFITSRYLLLFVCYFMYLDDKLRRLHAQWYEDEADTYC